MRTLRAKKQTFSKSPMKRHADLYERIYSRDNIITAFENASKGKAHYREVRQWKQNADGHIDEIEALLRDKAYVPSPYKSFIRNTERKARLISKLPFFPDRVIQHALCNVTVPIWEKHWIRDTYGSIKGRGIHDGVRRVKRSLKTDKAGTLYALKIDIRKYYPSINNGLVKQLVRKRIKCADTLWLCNTIIDSAEGLPIGNYTSQHLANLFLSDFDHWVKEELRVKHYFRYCDDMLLLSGSKEKLHMWLAQIREKLHNLELEINSSWQIFPVAARGIDFLGYRFYHTHTLLRKSIKEKYKKRLRQLRNHAAPLNSSKVRSMLSSYKGWMIHADTYNLNRSLQIT